MSIKYKYRHILLSAGHPPVKARWAKFGRTDTIFYCYECPEGQQIIDNGQWTIVNEKLEIAFAR